MRAITILQPWASLIAIGAKKIETRSWATKYRGEIAIHAGAKMPKVGFDLCVIEPFYTVLSNAGLNRHFMPLGCVIAIADLVDCKKILGSYNIVGEFDDMAIPAVLENGNFVGEKEFSFGNYAPGRYAWLLANVRQIDPVPAKGFQRLWNWEGDYNVTR